MRTGTGTGFIQQDVTPKGAVCAAPSVDAAIGLSLTRRWLAIAITALLMSGLLSLALVLGRLPGLDALATPAFFRRCLILHVDLALVVWFLAFLTAMFSLLPLQPGARRGSSLGAVIGWRLSVLGIVALVVGTLLGGEPVLANYVPVVDAPLYLAGLGCFGIGVLLQILGPRLMPSRERVDAAPLLPAPARPGLRAAGVAVVVAAITFATAIVVVPADLPADSRYELLFWGGGHVLQVAYVAAMSSVWILLLSSALERPVMSRSAASLCFAALVLPTLAAPLLTGLGIDRAGYVDGFTSLMRFGIFPAILALLALCLRAVWRAHRLGQLPPLGWSDGRLVGFAASAVLTVAGFILGALITGPNTTVPAHYHASIGGVTAAFMAATWLLAEPLGLRLPAGRLGRWTRWQPALFAGGQLVFAVGFGFAGLQGAARKTYAAEQVVRSTAEVIGLYTMGLGGLVAVAGGLLFLVIVVQAWRLSLSSSSPLAAPSHGG